MSTQKAVSANDQKNNGGTILKAGNYTAGNISNAVTELQNATGDEFYGAKVVLPTGTAGSSGNIGTQKPLSAGTFGYTMTEGNFIGKRLTTQISGTSNNFLQTGAADVGARKNPAKLLTTRRLHESSWNYVTGALTKGANAGDVSTYIDPATAGGATAGTDSAATPTQSVPGEFTYMYGAKLPQNDDYKSWNTG